MTSEELVKKIALDDPITSDDYEHNLCKFCGVTWAESSFDEYLMNQKKVDSIPADIRIFDLFNERPDLYRARNEHHDSDDCLWVLANEVMRSW